MQNQFGSDLDQSGLNELVQALYSDLHRLAAFRLRSERNEHTLQTTALLHEAYIKLSGARQQQFNDRIHFLFVASQVMRQVLIDYARSRSRKKRHGGTTLSADSDIAGPFEVTSKGGVEPLDILELERALTALAQEDNALAQLVELRYFGGMTAQEMADALGRSVHVIRHDLRFAQAWMRRRITKRSNPSSNG